MRTRKSPKSPTLRYAVAAGAAVLALSAAVILWPRAVVSHARWTPQVHRAQSDTVEAAPAPTAAEAHGEPTGDPGGAWVPTGARR